ncbi:MAG: c-type cytochrome [Methylotenera sp.]|nr:c-type cytochrome [Oligoflexia bacterium]
MEQHPLQPKVKKHHHHIMPTKTALMIGGTLLFLTFVTVWVAGIDFGAWNFPIAMLVATVKASLVALFFMNLYYDSKENGVIFITSILFLAIFLTFTATDLFFRGDVYVKGSLAMAAPAGKSKFTKPWVSTPELIAHGKTIFLAQCTGCHGNEGKGDGAAAAALNPHPRNFTQQEGWKNGRKPSQIFKTLKEGIAGSAMASYATLPADDRWGLVHFVDSLGGPNAGDTNEDLVKVGVDPNKTESAEAPEEKTIPVEVAMKRMVEDGGYSEAKAGEESNVAPGNPELENYDKRLGRSFTPHL